MIELINNYEAELRDNLSKTQSAGDLKLILERYHTQLRNFQHERLIHLLVTLTFVFASLVVFFLTIYLNSYIALALVSILLVMLLAYIYHYFKLENRVQKLYGLEPEIIAKLLNRKK